MVTRIRFRIFAAVLGALSVDAQATIPRSLYQAPEAMAMGQAVTGWIDDHQALWYNPAGAAAFDSFEWRMVTLDVGATNDVYESIDTIKTLKKPTVKDVNQFMGKNLYAQGNLGTSMILPQMGIAAMYDVRAGVTPTNQVFPRVEFGFVRTGGAQLAFGFSTTDGIHRRGRRKKEPQNEWRFGMGAKYFVRRGGTKILTAGELFNLNKENALEAVNGKGSSYGADLGVQRIQRIDPRTTLSWGLSYLNIGDLSFDHRAEAVKSSVNTGVGAQYDLGIPKLTVAMDVHHLLRSDDFRKKTHFGAKLRLPLLSFYLGLNQMRPTFGASVDIWLLRVSAVSFNEELGELYGANTSRRYLARVEFKMEF